MKFPPFLPSLSACAIVATLAGAQTTVRVSVDQAGVAGNGASGHSSISADRRYVAFKSLASNLVPGDTNNAGDIFVRDMTAGTTTRVSVGPGGAQSDGNSHAPSISADGRYVAFLSDAAHLVPGDVNGMRDFFVHDRQTGQTTIVSVDSAGAIGAGGAPNQSIPAISADGSRVAFASAAPDLVPGDTNDQIDVFVHYRTTGQTKRVSMDSLGGEADGESLAPAQSADGRFVAYQSSANNLVFGDANLVRDVFLFDSQTGQTTRVSESTTGVEGSRDSVTPAISDDGRFVAFASDASTLVAGDTNVSTDVFVKDTLTAEATRVSVASDGTQGDGSSFRPAISADGRFVAFLSGATNLVAGGPSSGTHAYVHDRLTGRTELIDVGFSGGAGDDNASHPALSGDGSAVLFSSAATNLVPGGGYSLGDVFRRDRGCALTAAYCTAKANSHGCTPAIGFAGAPSATSPAPFTISASAMLNQKNGLLFYGVGAEQLPFQGGWLCVRLPLVRTAVQNSAGSASGTDCTGSYGIDFNARIQSGLDANLVAGANVFAQYWARDPQDSTGFGTSLSDALTFVICP